MELNVHIKAEGRMDALAKLAEYVAEQIARGTDAMESNVPGVTAQGGGSGGPP